MSGPTLVVLPPAGVAACEPDIQAATNTVFLLRNRKKPGNFIQASVGVQTGYFSYYHSGKKDSHKSIAAAYWVQGCWK
jgi:hypothetical protein